MSASAGLRRIHRAVVAFVVAVAIGAATLITGAGTAHADNRAWLRPDATGHCEWDIHGWWVQLCDVWSPAMGYNVTVQVQPSARGGNAGYYLLDGLRATQHSNAWIVDVNAAATFNNSNITLAMPVGGAGSFYADWQGPATYDLHNPVNYQWETFLTSELPAYLETHFGVARNNNSIAGLSMGGTAALNLAAKHPSQFRQALSYSGYLTMTLPGAQTLLRAALLDAGGFNLNAMYGSMVNPRRFENDPFLNLGGLDTRNIYISAGAGIPATEDQGILPQHIASGMVLEWIAQLSTRMYGAKALAQGVNVIQDYPSTGLHNWNQFGYQLNKTKPLVLDTMNAW